MTVNLNQRHLVSDCANVSGKGIGLAATSKPRCGAWYKTNCVWCGAEIHMHRKQWGSKVQTCSDRCRVARYRAKAAGEPEGGVKRG